MATCSIGKRETYDVAREKEKLAAFASDLGSGGDEMSQYRRRQRRRRRTARLISSEEESLSSGVNDISQCSEPAGAPNVHQPPTFTPRPEPVSSNGSGGRTDATSSVS
ncbi:hypothetical protein MTO96_043741 [Rhipicephalus appendiculatus]